MRPVSRRPFLKATEHCDITFSLGQFSSSAKLIRYRSSSTSAAFGSERRLRIATNGFLDFGSVAFRVGGAASFSFLAASADFVWTATPPFATGTSLWHCTPCRPGFMFLCSSFFVSSDDFSTSELG